MAKGKGKRQKSLGKRQLDVIDDLLGSELDEAGVLAKHNVNAKLFRKWLASERFSQELSFRLEQLRRQGDLIIARYAPVAAMRLVQLAADSKEETARKACLDIISLPRSGQDWDKAAGEARHKHGGQAGPEPAEALSAETAGRLLAALAKEKSG